MKSLACLPCLLASLALAGFASADGPAATAEAGKTIGWRGDGTGVYPNATPPTEWYKKENGESKNILWETKLPCYSWATPIIVGDRVIVRSEPYDLICLNKLTGKILWIRSHPPFIAVTPEEKQANPAFKEIEALVAELEKVNAAFVKKGWTKELYATKYGLQKKIDELTTKADAKYELPRDMYVESWSGYTGSTPCSDGAFIYLISGCGITACYDLDGNRKWARFESQVDIWGEHGSACSPALVGDKLLTSAVAVTALDKATGREIWRSRKGAGSYSILSFRAGGVDYAIANGEFLRVSDGKSVFSAGGGMVTRHENLVCITSSWAGFYRWEAAENGELKVTTLVKDEYEKMLLPFGDPAKRWEPMFNFYTASPLYHDGLVYCLGNWGRLVVLDATKTSIKDGLVYTSFVPFDFRNPQGRKSTGMGVGASPALAGNRIYMIDSANCTVVMAPGREYRQIAKNTIDYTVGEGWEPKHWMGPHHEQTEASLAFDGPRIYIRAEQFLYCIGAE